MVRALGRPQWSRTTETRRGQRVTASRLGRGRSGRPATTGMRRAVPSQRATLGASPCSQSRSRAARGTAASSECSRRVVARATHFLLRGRRGPPPAGPPPDLSDSSGARRGRRAGHRAARSHGGEAAERRARGDLAAAVGYGSIYGSGVHDGRLSPTHHTFSSSASGGDALASAGGSSIGKERSHPAVSRLHHNGTDTTATVQPREAARRVARARAREAAKHVRRNHEAVCTFCVAEYNPYDAARSTKQVLVPDTLTVRYPRSSEGHRMHEWCSKGLHNIVNRSRTRMPGSPRCPCLHIRYYCASRRVLYPGRACARATAAVLVLVHDASCIRTYSTALFSRLQWAELHVWQALCRHGPLQSLVQVACCGRHEVGA